MSAEKKKRNKNCVFHLNLVQSAKRERLNHPKQLKNIFLKTVKTEQCYNITSVEEEKIQDKISDGQISKDKFVVLY